MEKRHKQAEDENFPVASFLLGKNNKKIVSAYYDYARHGDDIADDPALSSGQKLARLEAMENALYGKSVDESPETKAAAKLREVFLDERLDFSLASDLLAAFRQDAQEIVYETWGQLMRYCSFSAAPVGRFMLAIHNENPSTYLPANALCAALQIVNHIQDLKYDAKILKRVYIPLDLQKKFKVTPASLLKNKASANLQRLIKEMLNRVNGLMKDAEILPAIVKSRRLRLEICIINSLTNIMVKKIEHGDVLAKEIKLSKTDWLKGTLAGLTKGMLVRPKTLTNKGL